MCGGRRTSGWRKGISVAGLAAVVVAAGCATSGASGTRQDTGRIAIESMGVQNVEIYSPRTQYEQVIPAPEPDVWPHVRAAFEALEVEVTEVKPDQWIMGNPRFRPRRIQGERLSSFLDCGRDHGGPYADQYDVQMTLMTQLLRAPDGGTNVNVLLTAMARPRSVSGADLPCTSNRELEKRLVDVIAAGVAGA